MGKTEGEIAAFYDQLAVSGKLMVKDIHFWSREFGFLTRSQPKIFFDLGCGDGREARLCHEVWGGLDGYYGLDLSSGMLGHVKSFAPEAKLVQASLNRLPFVNNSLPVVWASASYLHVDHEGIQPALAELHRVMTPDGHGFISLKSNPKGLPDYNAGLVTYYGLAEFDHLLREVGFAPTLEFSDHIRDSRGYTWLGFFFTKKATPPRIFSYHQTQTLSGDPDLRT